MTFDEYQKQAITTEMMNRSTEVSANNPDLVAKVLGLAGESGEVSEKFKKIIRDKKGAVSNDDIVEITKELGDVLWYLSVIADYLGVPFEDVAKANLAKLQSRKQRGVQAGSGDNR